MSLVFQWFDIRQKCPVFHQCKSEDKNTEEKYQQPIRAVACIDTGFDRRNEISA